jgi:hypothetical protein
LYHLRMDRAAEDAKRFLRKDETEEKAGHDQPAASWGPPLPQTSSPPKLQAQADTSHPTGVC